MAIQIREARQGDGGELARLWLDMAEHLIGLDPVRFGRPDLDGFAEAMDRRVSQPDEDTAEFVAETDGHLVGFVVVRRLDPAPNAGRQILKHLGTVRAEVPALGVDSGWRRRGIGRQLMARAEAWALQRGARMITLDTYARSPLSNPFYQSLGYRVTSVTYERTFDAADVSAQDARHPPDADAGMKEKGGRALRRPTLRSRRPPDVGGSDVSRSRRGTTR